MLASARRSLKCDIHKRVLLCLKLASTQVKVLLKACVDQHGVQQVAADIDREVHAALHVLLLRLEPKADLEPDEALLGPEGPAIVDAATRPALFDLLYNPARYFTWDWLASANTPWRNVMQAIHP